MVFTRRRAGVQAIGTGAVRCRRKRVEHADFVVLGAQRFDGVRTDKSGAAYHQDTLLVPGSFSEC
jgi:hypothetical protein